MADDRELAEAEVQLATESASHRPLFVPIARAIEQLGGRARKRDVVKRIRELLQDLLNDKQLDHLEATNRFGWARSSMKRAGLVAGERGHWELTPLGDRYTAAHANDVLEVSTDIPEAAEPARSTVLTESVAVTGFRGYEIPLLEVMAEGLTDKKSIMDRLHDKLAGSLLPGDSRLMPEGQPVWQFRTHWSISNLGKAGFAENTGTAQWAITNAGRDRLEQERGTWRIEDFRNAKAKVRIEGEPEDDSETVDWDLAAWRELEKEIPKSLYQQIDARLRPDLGPCPDPPIGRNVILYGPPGTGKTFLAKAVARKLTGEHEVQEDGRLRLVQFHPSYAYEDFVQGLRPDTKETQLRYQLQKGPFLKVAEAAAQEPDAFFVLIIDEINRGDPARIFGELMYALEYRDDTVSLSLGGELSVPSNLVIIGTMNSVDRSVALVDYALRRRFGFIRIDPDPDVISRIRERGVLKDVGATVLQRFNEWIAKRLGREHALGHSFFISPSLPDDADDAFDRLWQMDVHPLLEEYLFGDEDGLTEAASTWASIVKAALDEREEVRADSEATKAAE